jgi:hypothetical protein
MTMEDGRNLRNLYGKSGNKIIGFAGINNKVKKANSFIVKNDKINDKE